MHERRVRWTEAARVDLELIVDFIAEDSVENAVAVLDRLGDFRERIYRRVGAN